MSARKPDLKLVAPTEFQGAELRVQIGKAVDTCFSNDADPVKGWILITLHENHGVMTAWNVKDSFLKREEIPAMTYHFLNDRIHRTEE
jgi:hypothetical protein